MNQFNIWNNPPNTQQQQQELSPDLLISKLNNLSSSTKYNNFLQNLGQQNYQYQPSQQQFAPQQQPFPVFNYESTYHDFNLPPDLQGGLSNIQSRRPSFTAELAQNNVNNNNNNNTSLEQIAFQNNHNFNNNMMNFRSRRPSIQIQSFENDLSNNINYSNSTIELDNGLLLHNGSIITSNSLQETYNQTRSYFSVDESKKLYDFLKKNIESNEIIIKIIINLKKLNNLFNLIKPLILVLTKSGKFEILSTPLNSNLKIQSKDVVICDGDRGKDLVYVLDGNLNLEMAILINYLKKKQHARAINYTDTNLINQQSNELSNTVEDLLSGNGILDEETQFQIPSKQILRFSTPQEIYNLKFKLIEEIKSYKTAILKINQNLELKLNLEILTSEYQFDQKKLTFYYRSNKRLDFRSLIKELFKIYKTRIWLCAVVNYEDQIDSIKDINYNLDTLELTNYKSDPFHVEIFEKLFKELLQL